MLKRTVDPAKKQESHEKSLEVEDLLVRFLRPFLMKLDQHLDRRVVNTLRDLVMIVVIHRHRNQGLILSELGGELLGEERAPAGTKRISNLLHSKRWQSEEIAEELWRQAEQKVEYLNCSNEEALVIWDSSEMEKPESLAAEGLCAVRSSKAARLKRIKPGYYNPPGGPPVFVPGFHWIQVIVVGMISVPRLALLRWWTSRGEQASDLRAEEKKILEKIVKAWDSRVIHLFDAGFAGSPWVRTLLSYPLLRFVLRWRKSYKLVGKNGEAKQVGQMLRGKRSMDHQAIWDARRRCQYTVGIVCLPVRLPDDPQQLWLVASRPGSGRKPWYLLTNQPITSVEDAWHIVFLYARRWQIEMTLRFEKCELAFESPRLRDWEPRMKFLLIAALIHAFLILLLAPRFDKLKHWLLDTWCHRNGKWSRTTPAPLYRLRIALSHLWRTFRPAYLPLLNSG